MIEYQYKHLIIKIVNESNDNLDFIEKNYSKQYFSNESEKFQGLKYGIRIFQNEKEINNSIIFALGGLTKIHQNSFIVDEDKLVICCSNTIFCLTIPELNLKWQTQADSATCFQIFKQKNDCIIHGETQITKLSENGLKKWEFIGRDIFILVDGKEEFKIENNEIHLTDFTNTKYKINFEGILIWDSTKINNS